MWPTGSVPSLSLSPVSLCPQSLFVTHTGLLSLWEVLCWKVWVTGLLISDSGTIKQRHAIKVRATNTDRETETHTDRETETHTDRETETDRSQEKENNFYNNTYSSLSLSRQRNREQLLETQNDFYRKRRRPVLLCLCQSLALLNREQLLETQNDFYRKSRRPVLLCLCQSLALLKAKRQRTTCRDTEGLL